MGRRVIDRAGQRFGRRVVLRLESTDHYGAKWACRCDCGNEAVVGAISLRTGRTRSCGCLGREAVVKAKTTHGQSAAGRRTSDVLRSQIVHSVMDSHWEIFEQANNRRLSNGAAKASGSL